MALLACWLQCIASGSVHDTLVGQEAWLANASRQILSECRLNATFGKRELFLTTPPTTDTIITIRKETPVRFRSSLDFTIYIYIADDRAQLRRFAPNHKGGRGSTIFTPQACRNGDCHYKGQWLRDFAYGAENAIGLLPAPGGSAEAVAAAKLLFDNARVDGVIAVDLLLTG